LCAKRKETPKMLRRFATKRTSSSPILSFGGFTARSCTNTNKVVTRGSWMLHRKYASKDVPSETEQAETELAETELAETELSEQDIADLQYAIKYADYPFEAMEKFQDLDELKKKKAVTPPERIPMKAGEYATELFEYASAVNGLDEVRGQLQELKATIRADRELRDILADNLSHKSEWYDALNDFLPKLNRALQRQIVLMIEQGKLHLLTEVMDNYEDLMTTYHREIPINIEFAKEPTPAKVQQLKAVATYYLPEGSNPIFSIKVRPELISGYIVDAGSYFSLDRSALKDVTARKEAMQQLVEEDMERVAEAEQQPWLNSTDDQLREALRAEWQPRWGAKTREDYLQKKKAHENELYAKELARFKKYFVDWA